MSYSACLGLSGLGYNLAEFGMGFGPDLGWIGNRVWVLAIDKSYDLGMLNQGFLLGLGLGLWLTIATIEY